jgi:hypothetical protein
MPALQALSIVDRTPVTPVVHNFTPRDVTSGVGLVVANAGVPLNEERLTVSMRKSGSKFRGKISLAVPVVVTEIINGVSVPSVARTSYVNAEFTFDESSTLQERTNLVGMFADSLGIGKALIHGAIVNLEGVYG